MSSKLFGSLVAGILVASPAFANKADAKKKEKKDEKTEEAGWCKSNACGGQVKTKDGKVAKNTCGGQMACAGITKEDCEEGGTWTTDPKPKK